MSLKLSLYFHNNWATCTMYMYKNICIACILYMSIRWSTRVESGECRPSGHKLRFDSRQATGSNQCRRFCIDISPACDPVMGTRYVAKSSCYWSDPGYTNWRYIAEPIGGCSKTWRPVEQKGNIFSQSACLKICHSSALDQPVGAAQGANPNDLHHSGLSG